jgi:hypothetical protein
MIDEFVLLTPVLLLAVVALLGFAGCKFSAPVSPGGVSHVQTTINANVPGTSVIASDPLSLQGGELIVATVQWGSAVVQPPPPILSGGLAFSPVVGGGPFTWNGMKIQSFLANNPAGSTELTVQVEVPGGSNVRWHLCVTAYSNVDSVNPIFSPQQNGSTFVGTNPQLPPISVTIGDLIYAVALAADSNGAFPGNNSIAAGPDFTAEFTGITNPLVEDGGIGNPVIAQATITSQDANPRAFLFGLGIKAAFV